MIVGSLKIGIQCLNLSLTLTTGQNFRWRKLSNADEWIGVVDNLYVVSLTQKPDQINYKILNTDHVLQNSSFLKNKSNFDKIDCKFKDLLSRYFNLDIDITDLYSKWSENDSNFARISSKFNGIRLLHQDFEENLYSFICSSNNNISRISKMVEALCNNYGDKLYSMDDVDVFSFPHIADLAVEGVEKQLRNLGFGYRARFIHQTSVEIMNKSNQKPDDWIKKLKFLCYEDAKNELMTLPGIGAKVADCICLMSLGFTEAIPVDTHVYQITVKHYLHNLKQSKSLTAKQYNQIGDFYREKFKNHPGWAQTVLFCSDLKTIH